MGQAIQINRVFDLVTEECCNCGIVFAVTAAYQRNLRESRQSFYCPNGHPQSYVVSTAEQLRKELAAKEQALTWEKSRAASLDQQLQKEKKATAKLKRRVSKGVCPCCKRTVSQLAQHMHTKHPEYVAAAEPQRLLTAGSPEGHR